MEADLLPYVASGGVLFGISILAHQLVIVVVALTATWSRKAYRRRSAQQVLRILIPQRRWTRARNAEPGTDGA